MVGFCDPALVAAVAVREYKDGCVLLKDFDFDATVVGAGAVGLACGRALSKRGLTVLVLEK